MNSSRGVDHPSSTRQPGQYGTVHGGEVDTIYFDFRLATVLSFTPVHSLRLTYGIAFEEPTFAELLVFHDIAPPADLNSLQTQYCGPVQIDCGFGTSDSPVPVRVLAVGNESLELQKTTTLEMGYRGVLGEKVSAIADFYIGRNQDFVTNFLPQPSADALERPGRLPILANLSYTNFGKVKTRGAEASANYFPDRHWMLSFAYAWFDFEFEDPTPGIEDRPRPNTPENSYQSRALALGSAIDLYSVVRNDSHAVLAANGSPVKGGRSKFSNRISDFDLQLIRLELADEI